MTKWTLSRSSDNSWTHRSTGSRKLSDYSPHNCWYRKTMMFSYPWRQIRADSGTDLRPQPSIIVMLGSRSTENVTWFRKPNFHCCFSPTGSEFSTNVGRPGISASKHSHYFVLQPAPKSIIFRPLLCPLSLYLPACLSSIFALPPTTKSYDLAEAISNSELISSCRRPIKFLIESGNIEV